MCHTCLTHIYLIVQWEKLVFTRFWMNIERRNLQTEKNTVEGQVKGIFLPIVWVIRWNQVLPVRKWMTITWLGETIGERNACERCSNFWCNKSTEVQKRVEGGSFYSRVLRLMFIMTNFLMSHERMNDEWVTDNKSQPKIQTRRTHRFSTIGFIRRILNSSEKRMHFKATIIFWPKSTLYTNTTPVLGVPCFSLVCLWVFWFFLFSCFFHLSSQECLLSGYAQEIIKSCNETRREWPGSEWTASFIRCHKGLEKQ